MTTLRLGLALALALLALQAAAPAWPAGERPSAADLEAELVCPSCKTTLDQSNAPVAERMKAYIRERLAAGATSEQVKSELVAQFGPGVLAEPPKEGFHLLAWLLPLAGLAAGALLVGGLALAWVRRREPGEETEARLDPELERRVDDELARFDG